MEKDLAGQSNYVVSADINSIREAFVAEAFSENVGRRAFILISPYPFLIIGEIISVTSDYLVIKAEVTNVAELDNEVFRVHIDNIEVFYIEIDGKKIPDIRDVHL
jgi:hypothetical protein